MQNNIIKFDFNKKTNPFIHGKYESEPELFLIHDGCKINDNVYVTVNEYIQFDQNYFDVVLHKNSDEIIIGRYLKEFKNIMASYNDGKIILYFVEYDYIKNSLSKIIKIINLYNIADDMSYSLTEKEALNLFDKSIIADDLLEPDNMITDYNINNKQKTLKKGISRFTYYGD